MKTIGVIAGMSWESSVDYYRYLNIFAKKHFGGLNSAKCLLYSVNFAPLANFMAENKWLEIEKELIKAAQSLEKAGADFIILATNTMHKMAEAISSSIKIPFLHIADCAAAELSAAQIKTASLLGTKATMELDFYSKKLEEQGIDVLIPNEDERNEIDRIIFEELCRGIIRDESRNNFLKVIDRLSQKGAAAALLACTEIAQLVKPENTAIKLFDTSEIHAKAAFKKSIE